MVVAGGTTLTAEHSSTLLTIYNLVYGLVLATITAGDEVRIAALRCTRWV